MKSDSIAMTAPILATDELYAATIRLGGDLESAWKSLNLKRHELKKQLMFEQVKIWLHLERPNG